MATSFCFCTTQKPLTGVREAVLLDRWEPQRFFELVFDTIAVDAGTRRGWTGPLHVNTLSHRVCYVGAIWGALKPDRSPYARILPFLVPQSSPQTPARASRTAATLSYAQGL